MKNYLNNYKQEHSLNQWAMGRVNSYITGVGGARKADADLTKKKGNK